MNKRNYQKELEKKLEELQSRGGVSTLFLHSCCAPCSSYVLEYLSRYFEITVFYYNPNIYPPSEYEERTSEQERLIREFNGEWENEADRHPIHFVAGTYVPDDFYAAAKGLEQEPEGGARCTECFKLRLSEAAREAKAGGFDFFTTTLTISPLKDAERLNRIGEEMGKEYGIEFLPSDFKKKTDISDPRNSPENTHCTGRITVGACSRRERRRRGPGAANRRHRRDQYKTPSCSVRSITPVSKSQSRQEKSFGQV